MLQILPHQSGSRFVSCSESSTRISQACGDLTELFLPTRTNQWFRASSPGHHVKLNQKSCRYYHLTAFWQEDPVQNELILRTQATPKRSSCSRKMSSDGLSQHKNKTKPNPVQNTPGQTGTPKTSCFLTPPLKPKTR